MEEAMETEGKEDGLAHAPKENQEVDAYDSDTVSGPDCWSLRDTQTAQCFIINLCG